MVKIVATQFRAQILSQEPIRKPLRWRMEAYSPGRRIKQMALRYPHMVYTVSIPVTDAKQSLQK